jgi:hypothetical protein
MVNASPSTLRTTAEVFVKQRRRLGREGIAGTVAALSMLSCGIFEGSPLLVATGLCLMLHAWQRLSRSGTLNPSLASSLLAESRRPGASAREELLAELRAQAPRYETREHGGLLLAYDPTPRGTLVWLLDGEKNELRYLFRRDFQRLVRQDPSARTPRLLLGSGASATARP